MVQASTGERSSPGLCVAVRHSCVPRSPLPPKHTHPHPPAPPGCGVVRCFLAGGGLPLMWHTSGSELICSRYCCVGWCRVVVVGWCRVVKDGSQQAGRERSGGRLEAADRSRWTGDNTHLVQVVRHTHELAQLPHVAHDVLNKRQQGRQAGRQGRRESRACGAAAAVVARVARAAALCWIWPLPAHPVGLVACHDRAQHHIVRLLGRDSHVAAADGAMGRRCLLAHRRPLGLWPRPKWGPRGQSLAMMCRCWLQGHW